MAYYARKSSSRGNNNLSVQVLLKLYHSMIVPFITYRSEICITDFKIDIKSSECFPFEKKNSKSYFHRQSRFK